MAPRTCRNCFLPRSRSNRRASPGCRMRGGHTLACSCCARERRQRGRRSLVVSTAACRGYRVRAGAPTAAVSCRPCSSMIAATQQQQCASSTDSLTLTSATSTMCPSTSWLDATRARIRTTSRAERLRWRRRRHGVSPGPGVHEIGCAERCRWRESARPCQTGQRRAVDAEPPSRAG